MNNVFEFASYCLHHHNIADKLAATHKAFELMQQGQLSFVSNSEPLGIDRTCFPNRPELRDPRTMPRRKLTTQTGLAAFFHAISHIEFMAIYLAWDMIYRFRGLPEQFYRDWLTVTDEEAQHFGMLQQHMKRYDCLYGDLPAHSGLWDVAEDTDDDLLARLALVPRYMEAHGLDVTPGIITKFETMDDQDSVALLSRILNDEVGHVQYGSFWFKKICGEHQLDPESHYRTLIQTRLKGSPRNALNRPLRKQAGFSDNELDWLESLATSKLSH